MLRVASGRPAHPGPVASLCILIRGVRGGKREHRAYFVYPALGAKISHFRSSMTTLDYR